MNEMKIKYENFVFQKHKKTSQMLTLYLTGVELFCI